MTRPHEFGSRDPGMCEILPPPTDEDKVRASLRLYREHAALYKRIIAEAEQIIEFQKERIARASDNLDYYEPRIEEIETHWPELAALQEVGE